MRVSSRLVAAALPFVLLAPAPLQLVRAQSSSTAAPVAPTPSAAMPPTMASVQDELIRVVKRVKPAVVTVVSERASGTKDDEDNEGEAPPSPPPSDPATPLSALGTGVVLSGDGLILTNYHVVRGASAIRVLFNAESEEVDRAFARLVGYDADADLALLRVNRTGLTTLPLADSDKVEVGQWALAVGAPFDQPGSVTLGIISARGRHVDKNGTPSQNDFLQTDAAINPGNSGGPLLNLRGEVVGINTAILSPSRGSAGIGFSIPANTIQRLLPILEKGGTVRRGFVGVQYTRLRPDVAREFGLPGGLQIGALAQKNGVSVGPAKEAGVREGDIITGVNGQSITTVEAFRSIILGSAPGQVITLRLARPSALDGSVQTLELPLTLGDRAQSLGEPKPTPIPAVAAAKEAGLGLSVLDAKALDGSQKAKWKLTGRESGAVVVRVADGSPADEGDVREGLRIVRARVGGAWRAVTGAGDWKKIETGLAPGAHVVLQLKDADDVAFYCVVVAPEKALL